ncbi:hypothetical protein STXM2123_2599 [Streptomyces sp. F-3]|nr:hypothetical protein STXM2123_2599 [Streptomyces sp. F-3]
MAFSARPWRRAMHVLTLTRMIMLVTRRHVDYGRVTSMGCRLSG